MAVNLKNDDERDLMKPEDQISKKESDRSLEASKLQILILRALDIFLSVIGLLLAAPLFPLIAVLIKLDSKGPVFYQAERVGKDMKLFSMHKFRTMLESSAAIDQSVCPQYDPRVTNVGRLLRRTKLNELPQLFNILKGEMSFVGPRPEAPDLAEMYPEEAKKVFSVKPGLVGPVVVSSMSGGFLGRNEEELYPNGVDPKQYYIQHILPKKVKIDLDYISRQTLFRYFRVIIAAAKETVFGAVSARKAILSKRQIYLFLADFILSEVSFVLAYWLFAEITGTGPSFKVFISGLYLIMIVRPLSQYGLGLYNIVLELITLRDIFRVLQAVCLGSLLLLVLNTFHRIFSYPPLLAIMDFILLSCMLLGVRLFFMVRFRDHDVADPRPRVAIYGAKKEGLKALNALGRTKNSPYNVVGFIDDAEEMFAKKVSGKKVLGNRYHIQALSALHDVQKIILAPDDKMRDQIDEVVALCTQAGLRCQIFTKNIEDETFGRISFPIRPVLLSDMLPRVNVSLDEEILRSLLPDKTVLMFGSGGELGSAICRYLFRSGCRKMVIVDRYKSYLKEILADLASDTPGVEIVPVVLNSHDSDALNKVFALHRPYIVIHAGMRKFIPFRKTDDDEVARSNYVRTFNLAKVSAMHGCEYFVMISSIKAAHGGHFVSESLRIAEVSLGRILGQTPTRLIVNRVGNIIENRGGIVSWLNDQIIERRPVRLPEEHAKAYLLSKNAAARSILQALATGSRISPGGYLLTSEPGICLEFAEVARKIALFYGIKLGEDIAVKFGKISDTLIQDEPSAVMAWGDLAAARSLEDCLESDPVCQMIEKIISGDTLNLSDHDWRQRTQEIISLCGSSLFSQTKVLFNQ
ncbi:MAG: sugar transferase [Candidatus Aminicenantes bacterium]|nr:MAG: sugar transferase [Candidatus Aminicenantes bacterium]